MSKRSDRAIQLRVVGGRHAGAELALQAEELLIVGCAEDSDIILLDPGVAPRHLALTVRERRVHARALDAALRIGDVETPPGASVTLDEYTPLAVGEAVIAVGRPGAPEWQRLGADLTTAETTEVRGAAPAESHALVPLAAKPSVSAGRRVATALASFAGAFVLLGVVWLLVVLVPQQRTRAQIVDVLEQMKLTELRITPRASGRVDIEGVVADDEQRARLARVLRERQIAANLKVDTGQHLVEEVRHVFRVHGVDAVANYQSGAILVERPKEKQEPAERALELARRDLSPSVAVRWRGDAAPVAKAEVIDETGSAAPSSVERPPVIRGSGDGDPKRVTVVIDGESAHVRTSDGTRYFVGSTLPQGFRIVAIEGTNVTVERSDGDQMRIAF
jgi:type III secretion system YscD/HrpQ family protein